MRISVGAFIPAAPFQAIASRASRRSPAGSGPTHRQTLPLGGVCVNRTSMEHSFSREWSDRRVALACKVSHWLVAAVRAAILRHVEGAYGQAGREIGRLSGWVQNALWRTIAGER